MSVRDVVGNVESFALSAAFTLSSAFIGTKAGIMSLGLLPRDLAIMAAENATPAFAVASGLYVGKLALQSNAPTSKRVFALLGAMYLSSSLVSSHVTDGPFVRIKVPSPIHESYASPMNQ
jgi:hypothetical protein